MILIDLQKAFDTLNHDILLDKMKYLGFTWKTIDYVWFLLKKAKHYCKPWGTLFVTGILNYGVPQGSLLVLYYFYLM